LRPEAGKGTSLILVNFKRSPSKTSREVTFSTVARHTPVSPLHFENTFLTARNVARLAGQARSAAPLWEKQVFADE